MKKLMVLVFALCATACMSQEKHNNCVAAFVGENMIVDEYSPRGKSVLKFTTDGILTVNLVELSKSNAKKGQEVKFYLAIKDAKTESLTMVSKKAEKSVDVSKVIKSMQKGDQLVLLLEDDEYALPHHEIDIEF